MGVNMPEDVLRDMLLQRLGHWRDLLADFVVAGFESGGSTSLVAQLAKSDDIYMMPVELADWAGARHQLPPCAKPGPPTYWPAFMSYAFWPESDTIERFNTQAQKCAQGKLVGVWDSRYAAHPLAARKIKALLHEKKHGRVLLTFRDPVKYVVSTFNRMSPTEPGGMHLPDVVAGTERSSDPFQLQLWKGNYTLLTRQLQRLVGAERVWLQPFELLREQPSFHLAAILRFCGSRSSSETDSRIAHENSGPRGSAAKVDPCEPSSSAMKAALQDLQRLYLPEYSRLARHLRARGIEVPDMVKNRRPDWDCS
eukprot:TRINITY_DN58991_c0_g1_i1.p1 TRINITY_DN58991_c0_g1~~TRINITY_DN58991_c0_g1_i1.p1  ORF type:complete len:351 (-),score=62.21 TRINITY_DN58991_c0_g1_i1:86-1015(-)